MKKLFLFLIISFFSFGCAQNSEQKSKQIENEEELTDIIKFDDFDVSMLRLIVTPEKYHNKTVQIIGYLNLEFEGTAVYFHKEDYEKGSSRNGLWVNFSDELSKKKDLKKYSKKYVILVGTFDMNTKGHMAMFGGTLKNITRLDEW